MILMVVTWEARGSSGWQPSLVVFKIATLTTYNITIKQCSLTESWTPRNRHQQNTLSCMNDAYVSQQMIPSLVQIMARCLFGAEPLSESMLSHCQSEPQEQTSVKFGSQYNNFPEWENVICKIAAIFLSFIVLINFHFSVWTQCNFSSAAFWNSLLSKM